MAEHSSVTLERNIAKGLSDYADQLISSGKPIEQAEWLAAFLGKGRFIGTSKPPLAQQTDQILKLRHALGEPMVHFNGVHVDGTQQYLLIRPEDYDPTYPGTFFRFGIMKKAAQYVGNISCRALQFWCDSSSSMPTSYNTEVTTLELLQVSRVRSTLSVVASSNMFDESRKGQNGFVVGLPAIREAGEQYPDASSSALRKIEAAVPNLRDLAEDHLARSLS